MSDLPTGLGVGAGPVWFDVLEAIGLDGSDEVSTPVINLLDVDRHTVVGPGVVEDFLRPNDDGTWARSCERWIRVRLTQPGASVGGLRFYVGNYAPRPGWELMFGTTDDYRTPTRQPSDIAVATVPAQDPGALIPSRIRGLATVSDWIVLQAHWVGTDAPQAIQGPALEFAFTWQET